MKPASESFSDLPLFAQGPTELQQALDNVAAALKDKRGPVPPIVQEAARIMSLYQHGQPLPDAMKVEEWAEAHRARKEEAEHLATGGLITGPDEAPAQLSGCNGYPIPTAVVDKLRADLKNMPPMKPGEVVVVHRGVIDGMVGGAAKGIAKVIVDRVVSAVHTSREAAESIAPHIPNLEERVLNGIRATGEAGACCHELEEALGMAHTTCSARITGLQKKSKIRASGRTRPTPSGRQAVVWVVAE